VDGGAGPLAVGQGVVVATGGDGIVALDTTDGELRWSSGGGRSDVGPGVVGDIAVIGDPSGDMMTRTLDRGQQRWRASGVDRLLQPVLASPDALLAVTADGVIALDPRTGEVRWDVG